MIVLSKSGPVVSYAEQTRKHLAAMEMQARAQIAATEARPKAEVSRRLHAARLYRDGMTARHAEALAAFRAAQTRRAAYPKPRPSITDRLMRRQPATVSMAALDREVIAARADLLAAERVAADADGQLARAERAEAAEHARYTVQAETDRRAAMEMLGEVIMAHRIVQAFPAVAYAGPAFVAWSGSKIERRRRRSLRNPFATNIWGIPYDFG